MRRLSPLLIAGLLDATDLGCGESPVEPTPAETVVASPELLIAGCESLTPGPVCLLPAGATLRLWVAAHRNARLVVERSGQPLAATWIAAEDGLRTAWTPDEPAGTLVLRDEDADWRIRIDLRPAPGLSPALQAIEQRSLDGDYAGAARRLADELPRLTDVDRAMALKMVGDNEFRRDDLPAMQRAYDDAFAAMVAAGLLRSANAMALSVVYQCILYLDDRACARRWLARDAELQATLPEVRVRHTYYAGLLADEEGDLRTAIRSFEQSAREARALGLKVDLASALLKHGALLGRIGDDVASAGVFAELLPLRDHLFPADRARVLNAHAWALLEARGRGEPVADPMPWFTEALAIVAPAGPGPDADLAAEIHVNRTHAALLAGELVAARATLEQSAPLNRRRERLHLWLRARIELAESQFAQALRSFDELALAAADVEDRWLAWNAEVGAGEALEGLARPAEALVRYRQAVDLHARRLTTLAVNGGREHLAAGGDRGARRLVDLLLRLGHVAEAACAARQARARTFAGLAAASRGREALAEYRGSRDALDAALEQTWDRPRRLGEQERARLRAEARRLDEMLDAALADTSPYDPGCDALRPPATDELILVYYPLDRAVAGFAIDAYGVHAAMLTVDLQASPAARVQPMLDPFATAIARARRIRVIASGPATAVAVHALPWSGRPLSDHAAIAYALDLPQRVARSTGLRHAVQLAPPSNLASAPDELAAAASALQARGVALTRLTGDEPDLRSRLAADLLHYVGHAHADSWASALHLGGERRLAAGDLISVEAPTHAVLSGCETGLADPGSHVGGMSLAHALLVAGSAAVIATDAAVDDRFAATLIPTVIAALADGVAPDEALRRAQREHLDHPEWSRFRVFVP